MAVTATVWEVRATGSDTNGGGFQAGASGTDYSQQDTAQVAVTDAVANGTTTLTSAMANFNSTHVGNEVYLQGGSGSLAATRRTVSSVTNATTVVVNATVATGTGITMNLGGALASPGEVGRNKVAGNIVYIKAGTYTLTTTTANVSGGVVSDTTGGSSQSVRTYWVGYDTTRSPWNTDAARPLIQVPASGVTSVTVFSVSGGQVWVQNVEVDGASKTSIRGFASAAAGTNQSYYRCKASNCTNDGFNNSRSGSVYLLCEATGCTTAGAGFTNTGTDTVYFGCDSHDNGRAGFNLTTGTVQFCISDSNTGAGFNADAGTTGPLLITHSVAYGNTGNGFTLGGNSVGGGSLVNCVAAGNGAFGAAGGTSGANNPIIHLATHGNTSGATSNIAAAALIGAVALSGDPFTNAAGRDFSPNSTSGAGAALRAAGWPGAGWPSGAMTSYADIGPIQHQDAGGGGGSGPVVLWGGMR